MQRRGEPRGPRIGGRVCWGWQLLVFMSVAVGVPWSMLYVHDREQGAVVRTATVSTVQLSRADVAAKLEVVLDASSLLGPCYKTEPLLSQMPQHACSLHGCLWSPHTQSAVSLDDLALPVPPLNFGSNCSAARGGQTSSSLNQDPLMSFVLVDDTDALTSAKRLLEVFRTANEVEDAEYLIYTLPQHQKTSIMIQAAQRLSEVFGASFVFRQAADVPSAQADAIEEARGEFLAFIGPTMLVTRGWLSAALATLQGQADVGAVGPLILGLGNNISDAGGTVDQEGDLGVLGRGQRVTPDTYYMREVDSLSLDCVVMRRRALRESSGFYTQILTKRYRGADLAMSLRLHGWRAVLQPLSLAFDLAAVKNPLHPGEEEEAAEAATYDRERFVSDWRTILQDRHCAPGSGTDAAAERLAAPRLLWIDDTPPQPDKDSGSIRALNLLHILLGEGYHITMLTMHAASHLRYLARLRHMGVRVYPKIPPEEWPLSRTGSDGGCAFDVAVVSRRDVFLSALPHLGRVCPGLPLVYDTVDLHFLREARDVLTGNGLNSSSSSSSGGGSSSGGRGPSGGWEPPQDLSISAVAAWLDSPDPAVGAVRAARDVELRLLDAASLAVVVSQEEVELIRRYRPQAPLAVVSNSHALEGDPRTTCGGRSGLLFVGNMNHPPNRQAVEAMILDVLPHLLRTLPWRQRSGLKLHVVASNAVPGELEELMQQHSAHVVFHGHLDDQQLMELYQAVSVAVAPLLSGAGVKGKVNQAMKLGVPVVGTPLAVEGMEVTDGVDCLVAATPQEFAAKVAQVYTDCALWERLAQGGYRNVQRYFSVQSARPALLQALSSVGVGPLHGYLRSKCQPLQRKYSQQGGGRQQVNAGP